jgi:elongation factor Ts
MTEIPATLVKTLRDRTGAGIMACRATLAETGGDLEAAIERLRDAQTMMVAKKAERPASEGLVALSADGLRGAMVELSCETDFVARGDDFRRAAAALAPLALAVHGRLDALAAAPSPDGDGRVADLVTRLAARTGEHVTLRRSVEVSVAGGLLVSYVHNTVAPGVGTIGVLVAIESLAPVEALAGVGRQIAMHVAASAPQWIAPGDVPAAVTGEKRAELLAQARTTGKPDAVVEKMVEGRLRKFVDEIALLRQPFVFDADQTVEQAIADAASAIGAAIAVREFARFRVGDGAGA